MIETWKLDRRLVVLDDLLEAPTLNDLQRELDSVVFHPLGDGGGVHIWKQNAPLNPEVGPTIVWSEIDEYRDALAAIPDFQFYPTGTALDRVLETARTRALETLGDQALWQDLAGVFARVYKYPPGTRLVWHKDKTYLAAFSSYFSPDWSRNWGGYFAFEDPENPDAGICRAVEPRCNRMVLFTGSIEHAILPVASDSKEPRVALSGFLVSRTFLQSLVERLLRGAEREPR